MSILNECLKLAVKISNIISASVFENSWNLSEFRGLSQEEIIKSATVASPILESPIEMGISIQDIMLIYLDTSNEKGKKKLFQNIVVGKPVMEKAFMKINILAEKIYFNSSESETSWNFFCDLLDRFAPFFSTYSWISTPWFQSLKSACFSEICSISLSAISTVLEIGISVKWDHDLEFCDKCFLKLWSCLDISSYTNHLKIIRLLVKLGRLYNVTHIEKNISIELNKSPRALEKFGVVWKFFEQDLTPGFTMAMPLCAIFNSLLDENQQAFFIAKSWIYNYVSNCACIKMIHPLLSIFHHPDIVLKIIDMDGTLKVNICRPYNQSQVVYALDVFVKLVHLGSDIEFLGFLSTPCPSSFILPIPNLSLINLKMVDVLSLYILLISLAKEDTKDLLTIGLHNTVRMKSIKLLRKIFASSPHKSISQITCTIIHKSLLQALCDETIVPIQVELLNTLRAISDHLFNWVSIDDLYKDSGTDL